MPNNPNYRKYFNPRTIRSAFVGGIGLALIQLIFDHDDPLCWQWHCLRHYIGILIFGGLRSAWEYIKVPSGNPLEEAAGAGDNNGSKSAAAGS